MTKARDISSLIGSSGQIENDKITLDANEIPNLDTAKITSGTLDAARIDNSSLSNVTQLPFSAGTDWQSTIVTGTTLTAVAGKGYWIDTTSNACTVTLPASASVGDFIEFADYSRTWGTNAVTLNQNSLNFQGNTTPNPQYNTDGQSVRIVYSGATQGWIPTSDDDVTFKTPAFIGTAEYLVVAGGGGGADGKGGGGGAGGYLTNYGGTAITLTQGATYTVTVGAGGTATAYPSVSGQGGNSVLSGTGITTITSIGGGGGGSDDSNTTVGLDGGSGGGGACGGLVSTGGSGTSGQGNDGGNGDTAGVGASGGGGGAGSAGSNGVNGTTGGDGGDGLQNSITGTATYYAGGGGGVCESNSFPMGSGGLGGGADGGFAVTNNGTANTGGGGGGNHSTNLGGNGGSGVVILRVPSSDYSVASTTGSPTVTTDGSDTVIKFTSSGSYTA